MKLSALDIGPTAQTLRLAMDLEAARIHRHLIAEHKPRAQPTIIVGLMAGSVSC